MIKKSLRQKSYDLVNFELNKIEKQEYIIFEEKTIAYLEDVKKGNDAAKNKTFDVIVDKKSPKRS